MSLQTLLAFSIVSLLYPAFVGASEGTFSAILFGGGLAFAFGAICMVQP